MTANKHNSENKGAKLRDHSRPQPHFWHQAHRDWRVWCAVVLMLAAMLIYVRTENLSLRPGEPATQAMPAASTL